MVPVLEVPAPSAERMLALPIFPEQGMVFGPGKVNAVFEQVEVHGQPVAVV
jgi:hypothetical protein